MSTESTNTTEANATPISTQAPTRNNGNYDDYKVTFGCTYIQNGVGAHGTGTDKELVVTIDSSRRDSVPDDSDGYKLLVLRVYPEEVVGFLNHDTDRVEAIIAELRKQLEFVADEDVERDLSEAMASYSKNDNYSTENAFLAVLEFRQQTKRGSGELQMVAKIGNRINGRGGMAVFGKSKNGIPMPDEAEHSVWRMCAVFMSSEHPVGIAVALPDVEALKDAIGSLNRQIDAIAKKGKLSPVNGEAKKIARDLMASLKRA